MHEIRKALRGRGVVLMGKNTMVRRAIRILASDFPEYERLLPHVKGMLSKYLGFWILVLTMGD
jgi:large subunit ribosomal protein LP0